MPADREAVLAMINAAWICQVIGVACDLGLPDRIAEGTRDARELAAAVGVSADALQRLLRALLALGLVDASDDRTLALTAEGMLLTTRAEGSVHAWAIMNAKRGWSAWTHLGEGIRTGRNVRDLARLEAYSGFDGDPAAASVFNRAMADLTRPVALALRDKVPFSGHEYVIDVGGGAGHLVAPLLAAHPSMRAIVFDLDHARPLAEEAAGSLGLGDRCRFVAGSFFDGVPSGADVYLLKSVLHNWDDADALRILLRCREAMAPGRRLVVLERVLAPRAGRTPPDRENARSDLQMLLTCDGRERDERAFRSLLEAAGLRAASVTPLTGLITAIEARAV